MSYIYRDYERNPVWSTNVDPEQADMVFDKMLAMVAEVNTSLERAYSNGWAMRMVAEFNEYNSWRD